MWTVDNVLFNLFPDFVCRKELTAFLPAELLKLKKKSAVSAVMLWHSFIVLGERGMTTNLLELYVCWKFWDAVAIGEGRRDVTVSDQDMSYCLLV